MAVKKSSWFFDEFSRIPDWKELVFDLAAFIGIAIMAVIQDWKATDIVWAAWLSSLLTGLSFFLVIIIKITSDKVRGINTEEEKGSGPGCLGTGALFFMVILFLMAGPGFFRYVLVFLIILDIAGITLNRLTGRAGSRLNSGRPVIKILASMPSALFMFFFFLGHFGGFHAGHALFLGILVPPELDIPGTLDSLADARELFISFFRVLISEYWPYLLSVAVMNFSLYKAAIMSKDSGNNLILPYKNVIRIHILIFILAPLSMLGAGKIVLMTVLFFFYFPVEKTIAWNRRRRNKLS